MCMKRWLHLAVLLVNVRLIKRGADRDRDHPSATEQGIAGMGRKAESSTSISLRSVPAQYRMQVPRISCSSSIPGSPYRCPPGPPSAFRLPDLTSPPASGPWNLGGASGSIPRGLAAADVAHTREIFGDLLVVAAALKGLPAGTFEPVRKDGFRRSTDGWTPWTLWIEAAREMTGQREVQVPPLLDYLRKACDIGPFWSVQGTVFADWS